MGDHQKIHPVDMEALPTLPLVAHAHGSSNSERGDRPVVQQHYPPLVLLRRRSSTNIPAEIQYSKQPPPPHKRISCCCCKCICWTISVLVLLLIITAAILYLVFQPKLPKYSVDKLSISELGLNYDMSLYAKFDVKITAKNPNKKIGIYYEKGSRLSVWYTNAKLCQGSLPRFYQGHHNTTLLHVALTGQTQYGSTLMAALQEQQQTGRIPLDLKVDVPVSIKLGKFKMMQVRILGSCMLIVDSLSADNLISIKTSTCKFRLKL